MGHPYLGEFRRLGKRYRNLRAKAGMVQEDVIDYGFSVRHYQQLEAGRPHSLTTLFRIAKMLRVRRDKLLKGLSKSTPKKSAGGKKAVKRSGKTAPRKPAK